MRVALVLVICSILLAAGCQSGPSSTPTPDELPTSSSSPSPTPTATAPSTPSASPAKPTKPVARPNRPVRTPRIKAAIVTDRADGVDENANLPLSSGSIYLRCTPQDLPIRPQPLAHLKMQGKETLKGQRITDLESRTLLYKWVKPEGGWAEGEATFEITLGEEMLHKKKVRFGEAERPKFKDPEYAILTDDLTTKKPKASFTGANKDIFLVVATYHLPRGTPVRTLWIAREVDQLEPGELVAESQVKAPGPDRDALFAYAAPPQGFLAGSYEVHLYFANQKVGSRSFWIQTK